MPERIVCFGGSFDPVHNGHLIVARAVAEARGFERITLVPAANPPHKPPTRASAADRLAMLRLAIEGEGLFDICQIELDRTGPSYTLDTLTFLRRSRGQDAEIHWIIGSDMLAELHRWHRAEELLRAARMVVVARPPWRDQLDDLFVQLRLRLPPDQVLGLRESVVDTPLIDISSTEIRHRAAAGMSVRYLVPEPVADYISRKGLYSAGRGEPAG